MVYLCKNILLLFLIILHSLNSAHGFGSNTLIQLTNHAHTSIYHLCLDSLKNNPIIASYDLESSYLSNQCVNIGKKSKTNCYINIGFSNQFDINYDITCTPSQEFYVPKQRQWLPAYMLKAGDGLLSFDGTIKTITLKKLVLHPLKIYMIEVENTHTFFVSKYSILTHNIFLPIAISTGISIPFGSIIAGSIGNFFGTIAITTGFTLGGLFGLAIKSIYDKHIHRYTTPRYNTAFLTYFCANQEKNSTISSPGCFNEYNNSEQIHQHIIPIEYPSLSSHQGCIEINILPLNHNIKDRYDRTNDPKKPITQGCFQPHTQAKKSLNSSDGDSSNEKNTNKASNKLTARTWGEFERNCPIGQQYGKKFIHIGKQNTKDGCPIRQLSEDIPNTEMFKKNYFLALDRFHDGDHFEVWDKRGNWIGVANLDGSKNHKKSNAEKDPANRSIKNII